jgi:carboxymethylenebutenolidase
MTRGKSRQLTASDKFQLGGYRADPATPPEAAIVLIQEIFAPECPTRWNCEAIRR